MVADRDQTTGTETVELINSSGGDALFCQVDVSDKAQVAAMVDQIIDCLGRLDCAVNNAAFNASFASFASFEATQDTGWDKTINTSLRSVFLLYACSIKSDEWDKWMRHREHFIHGRH